MNRFASPLRDPRAAAAVVGLVATLVFGNSLANGFAYDDDRIVVDNVGIQSLETLPAAVFETPYWPDSSGEQLGLWRPVTTALLGLEYVVSGGSPRMFHAVNVVAHMVASVLALLLFVELMSLPAAFAGGGSSSRCIRCTPRRSRMSSASQRPSRPFSFSQRASCTYGQAAAAGGRMRSRSGACMRWGSVPRRAQ